MKLPSKLWIVSLSILIGSFTMSGCSSGQNDAARQPPTPIKVHYSTSPSSPVKADSTVKITVTVQQNGELIKDAEEVEFEIWKENQEKHDMVKAQKSSSGEYYIERKFPEAGTYYVMYHVTARDVHNMQKKELQVVN